MFRFVHGVEDVWSETFERRAVLESFVLPNYTGLHGCTKSVSEWPFLRAVLGRTSDKCRVQSLVTLNAVDSDMRSSHKWYRVQPEIRWHCGGSSTEDKKHE